MRALIIIAALMLMAGPLRRPLLSAWRLVLPLTIGGIAGSVIIHKFMPGAPGWMLMVGPVFGALMLGAAVRELIDTVTRK